MDIRNFLVKRPRLSSNSSNVAAAQENTSGIEDVEPKEKKGNNSSERKNAEESDESTVTVLCQCTEFDEPTASQKSETSKEFLIVEYDIWSAVAKRRTLKRSEIYNYLMHTKTPAASFKFPLYLEGHQSRRFQYHWLQRFKWLAYSEEKNGTFCKYCVLFAPNCGGFSEGQDLKTFVSMPLTKYKKAIEEMERHGNLSYHCFSKEKALEFMKNMDNQSSNAVDILLDKEKLKII
ncbi:uncharacterized protein LOC117169805 [Belonocnema kinseyi]|uniref:uncharacterized protein LOC117169805 n=1 Tax=Belonocnema kinseyi TaxID=2817044 RepID=UPI00143D551F|nr:uncharacterized protein LOC117169805 [Belonocnema kinseyi]